MKLLGSYQNGNYTVRIFEDGTKIRETEDDEFVSSFPECIDIKITNQCDMECPYCHEASTVDGQHGDIMNTMFIDNLQPFTELAIGGGNPLCHPDLVPFLEKLSERKIIANMTVNQKHFEENIPFIQSLVDKKLIYGLGVSLIYPTHKFIKEIKQFPNAVIHVINGVVTINQMMAMFNQNLKILILGYKTFRRGNDFYSENVEHNQNVLNNYMRLVLSRFKVVSFDNLALKQLSVKELLSEDVWNNFFMGDDGKFTMYIDMVNNKFAQCSTATTRHDLLPDISDMFDVIKNEGK